MRITITPLSFLKHAKFYFFASFLACLGSMAEATIVVQPDQILQKGTVSTYTYHYWGKEMQSDLLSKDAAQLKNVSVINGNVSFVSANEGETEAEILYCFDFSEVPFRPSAVTWSDNLSLFHNEMLPATHIEALTEWSLDGETYHVIQKAILDTKRGIDSEELMGPRSIEIKDKPRKLWYRVRFQTIGEGNQFHGHIAQWNRSDKSASLFRASFQLEPLESNVEKGGMQVSVAAATELDHIIDGMVYPNSFFSMDRVENWKQFGGINGQKMNVEVVDSPERPGEHALKFSVKVDNSHPDAPAWLAWRRSLETNMRIAGSEELVFDIYPLDDLSDMPFRIQWGRPKGFGVTAAVWKRLPETIPGEWNEVRLPIGQRRSTVDEFAILFKATDAGVPEGVDRRFIIDNIRMEPTPNPLLENFSGSLKVSLQGGAAYWEQVSHAEISDNEPLKFFVEVTGFDADSVKAFIKGVNLDNGNGYLWSAPTELYAPNSVLTFEITDVVDQLGVGAIEFQFMLQNTRGDVLIQNEQNLPLVAYSSRVMNQARRQLLARLGQLDQRVEALRSNGFIVDEPNITLVVARRYLQDGGYVEYDYNEQKARGIAMKLIDQISGMMDRAESDLDARERGDYQEAKAPEYNEDMPITQANGRIMHDGQPFLFFGPLTYLHHEHELIAKLGFNAMSSEIGMKRWIGQPVGSKYREEYIESYLNYGRQFKMPVNFLFSGHYIPDDLSQYGDALTSNEGVGMFPWNVLSPEADRIFNEWYEAMFPYLGDGKAILAFGTVNEPGYVVDEKSKSFEKAFGPWVREEYGSVEKANEQWGSAYSSFDIDLPSFFKLRENSLGAEYDWNRYVDAKTTEFLVRRKDKLRGQFPSTEVWVKLMGSYKHFGFTQLNELSVIPEAQTVVGSDGTRIIWNDFIKSIDPSRPNYNTEWHFMHFADPVDPASLTMNMFEGVVHGINAGLIWTWSRSEWVTDRNGVDQSITRWPITVDSVGRTVLRMRTLAGPLTDLGNIDGGAIRLLYSLASNTHLGTDYVHGIDDVYQILGQNASGNRFEFTSRLKLGDLEGIELLAAPGLRYVEADAVDCIIDWVAAGGVLWVDGPMKWSDPWGHSLPNLPASFKAALSTQGVNEYQKGKIYVGVQPELADYCDGPWAIDVKDDVFAPVDIRHLKKDNGGLFSVINKSSEELTIQLEDGNGHWSPAEKGFDLWSQREIDLSDVIDLPPNGILLIQY